MEVNPYDAPRVAQLGTEMRISCRSWVHHQGSWNVGVLEGLHDLYSIIAVHVEAKPLRVRHLFLTQR
jgi:hypothetical protein